MRDLNGRLAKLEARLAPPPTNDGQAGQRLAEQLAKIAQRLHDDGTPLVDAPREAPVFRVVVAALQDAAEAGEWGSPEHGATFWRRVMRYAFAVHGSIHHDGGAAVYERLPEIIARTRAACDAEDGV
jgi:hypothetical protein